MRFCTSHSLALVSDLTAAICNCRNETRRKLTCFILHLLVLSLMFLPKANKKQIHGLLFAQRSGPDAKWENPYRANTWLINASIYYQFFSYHALIIGFFLLEIEWKAFVEMGRRVMIWNRISFCFRYLITFHAALCWDKTADCMRWAEWSGRLIKVRSQTFF